MERPIRMLLFVREEPAISIAIGESTARDEKGAVEMMQGGVEAMDELNLTERSEVSRGGASGVQGRGEKNGLLIRSLALRHATALTTIIMQHDRAASADVDEIIESVTLNPKAELNPLRMHGLTIGDLQGLEIWPVMSHPVMLREPGTEPPFPADALTFALMVLPYAEPNPTDRDLGKALGRVVGHLRPDMERAAPSKFELGGRQGFEIVAPGQKDGAVIDVYAFMVRGNDSAFAGFGHVGKKQSAETVKRLSKLVRSVELDDSILGPVTR
jgi:hypothetical protein